MNVGIISVEMTFAQQANRFARAAMFALICTVVSLILAAVTFFALMILIAETGILPAGLGEDFILIFSNVLPAAVIAMVSDFIIVLRPDARGLSGVFTKRIAVFLIALCAVVLWMSFWFSTDRYPSGGSDLGLLAGTFLPTLVVVASNWVLFRLFLRALGLDRL